MTTKSSKSVSFSPIFEVIGEDYADDYWDNIPIEDLDETEFSESSERDDVEGGDHSSSSSSRPQHHSHNRPLLLDEGGRLSSLWPSRSSFGSFMEDFLYLRKQPPSSEGEKSQHNVR
jgi:hypothetical protein